MNRRPRNIIFIPARKGSSRIKNKNLKTIHSSTLIEICIKKAINLKNDDTQIVLSTDFSNKELNLSEFISKNIVIVDNPLKLTTRLFLHYCSDSGPTKTKWENISLQCEVN